MPGVGSVSILESVAVKGLIMKKATEKASDFMADTLTTYKGLRWLTLNQIHVR